MNAREGGATKTPSRTDRGWVVVGRNGRLLMNTLRPTRARAIIAYTQTSEPAEWKHCVRVYGVQVVRCTITTEPSHR